MIYVKFQVLARPLPPRPAEISKPKQSAAMPTQSVPNRRMKVSSDSESGYGSYDTRPKNRRSSASNIRSKGESDKVTSETPRVRCNLWISVHKMTHYFKT